MLTTSDSGTDGVVRPEGSGDETRTFAIDARGLGKVYTLYPNPSAQLGDLLGLHRLMPWRRREFASHRALDGVDLQIAPGERVGVIGRNGAGKTTLLKLITGAAEPTSGSLSVRGEVQALMQVGLGFHPEFTGRENIAASLVYTGLTGEDWRRAEADIISFCELGKYLDQPLKTYSLGMQSRLQFACATAIRPEILIVDEILGAGDAYFSVKSSQRMERLTKSGCTLLLVSHSMAQILQFCERCIWIDGGRVVESGPARKVVGAYEVFMERLSKEQLGRTSVVTTEKTGKSFQLGEEVTESSTGETANGAGLHETGNGAGEVENTATADARVTREGDRGDGAPEAIAAQAVDETSGDAPTSPRASQPHATSEHFVDVLEDGQKVYRWPAEPGPKLVSLEFVANGDATRKFAEGADVEIRIWAQNAADEPIACRFQITIFSIDNRRITRLLGPVVEYSGARGEVQRACVSLSPCLLLTGEYYVNFAILPEDPMRAGVPTFRYDLVSRFSDFEVTRTLDYRDPCVFTHPAEWTVGGVAKDTGKATAGANVHGAEGGVDVGTAN